GMRRSASLTSPQISPASATILVTASPPRPPPAYNAMRWCRRSVTGIEVSGYVSDMRYSDSLVELIGNTPLVRLRRVTAGLRPTVLAKVEYFNPGGSVKDRIAVRMIDAAEESGELQPGGTIVEPTSGNTGVGLALVAQQRGYKCIFVCPDQVSGDKIDTFRPYLAMGVAAQPAAA